MTRVVAKEFTIFKGVDAGAGKEVSSYNRLEKAKEVAKEYSEAWDCDCHIEDSQERVVATFTR